MTKNTLILLLLLTPQLVAQSALSGTPPKPTKRERLEKAHSYNKPPIELGRDKVIYYGPGAHEGTVTFGGQELPLSREISGKKYWITYAERRKPREEELPPLGRYVMESHRDSSGRSFYTLYVSEPYLHNIDWKIAQPPG